MPAARDTTCRLATHSLQAPLNPDVLPPKDSSDLSLGPASSIEFEQTWRLNANEWKGFLDESAYYDREIYLLEAALTRNGGATAWILTSPSLPLDPIDQSRPILASCETARKTGYVAKDGTLEKIVTHGIGSVYNRPEYRGRGYGQKMIQELAKKLDSHQQLKNNKGRFSVLYSDIGPKFYAKQGWKAFPSTHVSLRPIDNEGEYHQRLAEITPRRNIKDLTLTDLESLEQTFVTNLETSLKSQSQASPSKTLVAFQPSIAQFEWHFMREDFLTSYLDKPTPTIRGALDTETGIALIWARTYASDPKDWHLSILLTHIPTTLQNQEEIKPALSSLLLRAQWEAQQWNMAQGVEVWDPEDATLEAAKAIAHGEKIQVTHRDMEHICSLRWNGDANEEVVWVRNERYAWC